MNTFFLSLTWSKKKPVNKKKTFFICVAYEAFVQHILSFFFAVMCVCVLIDLPQEDFVALYIRCWTRVHSSIIMRWIKIALSILSICVSLWSVLCVISVPIYYTNPRSLIAYPYTFNGLVLLTCVSCILRIWYFVFVHVKLIS